MKRNKNIFAAIVVILLMVSGTFSACTEDEPELQLPYLFRPINFQVELNKTIATITWSPVDSAVSYTLQLSNDSLDYSSPILDITTTKLSVVKELAGDTKFYARIRANSGIESKSSKFNTTLSFKTPKENAPASGASVIRKRYGIRSERTQQHKRADRHQHLREQTERRHGQTVK